MSNLSRPLKPLPSQSRCTIGEWRSFDRAQTNLTEQDVVLDEAALLSIHCEHQVQIKKRDLSIDDLL